MNRLSIALVIILGLMSATGMAGAYAQSTLGATIPKAVGEPHPEGNEFMRINHMDLLRHDRDRTVYLGNREVEHSLKECVACHAMAGPESEPVSYESEQHICRECHDFAAVQIDCFSCHQSKPDEQILQRLLDGQSDLSPQIIGNPDAAPLVKYLNSTSQASQEGATQ